ncbi:MAG: DUF6491 family protein [Hyphomonadaceae bacterium]
MTHAIKTIIAVCASALAITACSSAPVETAEAKPDLRQRQEVRSVCFQSQIKGWRPNDHRSLIVHMKSNEEYKLQLIGACNPRDNQLSIAFINPAGGTCVQSGSTLTLMSGLQQTAPDGPRGGGSCSIEKIYKWDRDAAASFGASSPTPLSSTMGVSR